MNKMEKKDCGGKSTFNVKVFNYANSLMNPTDYDYFYLEYLETSLLRYTQEMQYLLGLASADFTF